MKTLMVTIVLLGIILLAGCPPKEGGGWQDLMYGEVSARSVYGGYIYVWFKDGGQLQVPLQNIVDNKAALMPGASYIVQYDRNYEYYRFIQDGAENQIPVVKR